MDHLDIPLQLRLFFGAFCAALILVGSGYLCNLLTFYLLLDA